MKAKKRFLSLLLCGAMLFSLCPQAAFAEGAEADGLCEHHPQHTAECGYAPGTEGTPCTYVCEICNPQDSGEAEETEPEAECICTGLCVEDNINSACPVCGAANSDLVLCLGMLPASALAAEHDGFTYEETTDQISGITRTYTGGSGDNLAPDISTPGISKIEFKVNDTLTVKNSINITASISLTEIVFSSGNVLVGGDITAPTQIIINGGYVKASNIKAVGRNVSGDTSAVSITGGIVEVTGEISSVAQNQQSSSTVTINGNTVVFAGSIKNNNTDVTPTQGVVFVGDTGKVYGSVSLPGDIEIPEGYTLTVPSGTSLTIPAGTTLTNNGTISIQGNLTNNGTLLNNGTINGDIDGKQPTYSSKVTVSFSQNGQPVTSVPYGSTVTITATMEKAETAANALSADTGKVDFYLGDANDTTGMKMGIGTVEFEGGAYTASVDVTIGQDKGFNNAGTFKFTADFGGYAPDGDKSGDSLAPNTGSAQLTVVESYSIDYEKETITIAEGYSLYTQQSDGEAIFTSTGENNTTSLTGYIQNTEQKLYLQAPASGEGGSSNRREITIPARPVAPTVTIAINYSEEKLKFPPGTNISNLEYSTDTTDITNWNDIPSGAALSEMGWDGSAQKTYYFRTGATDASFAGSATTTPIVAPARPAKPADPTTVEVTSDSITIQVVSGQEYRLGSSGDWSTLTGTTGSDGKTVYTYNNLDSGTQYTIATRTPADDNVKNQFASHPATVTVTTKYETELGGLEVSGNTGFQGHFQYGDVITVTFTPEQKANTSTNALAENTATLTYTPAEGAAVDLATATAQADGSFELTYDTKEKKLPIGENLMLTVSYGGNGALNPVEESVTLSLDQAILKNMPTVTGSFVYGGTLTLNYTPQDDEEVTYQWWRIIDDSSTERIDGATGETYTLTESEIGGSIYIIVSATDEWHRGAKQSDQYQISKAPGSIVIACDSVTYGENVQPSVTSNTNEGADVTYSYAGTGSTSYGPSATAPINAGTYTVTATVAETATHTAATSEPVTFTIRKATLTAPQNLSLTSTAPGKATAAWDEVQNASGYTVQLYKDGEADSNPTITTGTSCEFSIAEAGSYTVKVKANGSDNYADSTEAESNSLTFYTVTVNGSYAQTGGTDVYTEGATVSIDAGTRAGYTFDGWTSSDGVTFADANSAQTTFTMPGKPVTVTASWVPNSSEVGDQEFVRYIVQHYKQNTDGSYRLEDAEYPIGEVGDTVTVTARNYEGYTYNAEKSNASGTLTEIKSDADIVTLKLYYDLTVFTVTVETSGNGTASASPASATMGQTVTLTANAASGYHFVKWEVVSGDIVLNGNTFTMPAGNVTVKAVFERTSSGGEGGTSYDYFTISASAGEGGSISPAGNISVREGLDKTFTITPADGYIISDVRVDGVSVGAVSSYTFDNVQKRHTIKAVFAKENPETGVDNPFTDVHTGDWFYDDVMFVYENGLMVGTSDTTFGPNEAISRAQVAVIFYRMAGSPEVTGESAFTDVVNGPGTAWYYNAVLWAQQNGIVSGHGDDTFRPNDNITREQLAMIFYNYARYKGYDVSATDDLSGFTDAGDVSGWALPAMRWAVGSGIMGGYGDGILGPQETATRAQVAAMLHRFIENNKLVPPTVAPGGDSGTTGTGGTGSGGGGWTQQTTSPQTGDSSNIGLWISLCALSLAGLVGTSIWYAASRRRYETEASSHPLIP